jgi:RimJ/RimL family protein N-acetyltransferase
MLEKIYSKESLIEQIYSKKHQFYLVLLNEMPVGFISISFENEADLWIHKFYISQDYQGNGIGKTVFCELLKIINEPKQIRLTVNRQNYKSINFYFKLGFKIEKVADFDIGNGYFMNDFVMLKK